MAATNSVKVTKTFLYRGATKAWTNRYHFNGGTPPDTTHWNNLFDAIVLAEKACHDTYVTITQCDGYLAGSDLPVATKTYTTAGTFNAGSGVRSVGETCALIRYSTAARSSRNHPVYLFNYMHAALMKSTSPDELDPTHKTAYETYATAWLTGFSDGGSVTAVRAGPRGANATARTVEQYLTHRDFPR